MSYILDALKKSDQQRQRGLAPTLMTVQTVITEARNPVTARIYGWIAMLVIIAGVAVADWLRPWQHGPAVAEAVVKRTVPSKPANNTFVSAPLLPELARKPVTEQLPRMPVSQVPMQSQRAMKLDAPAVANAEVPARPAQAVKAVGQEATPASAPVPEKPVDTDAVEAPRALGVIAMNELPLPILKEIPSMSIQIHAYSDTPTERLVGINDQLLKEGDYLAPGLRLEQIMSDGMIFSYKKYRFRHGVQ